MKYVFRTVVMISGFLGFSQAEIKSVKNKVVTFPNGDESITIIEKDNTNLIRLGSNESYKRFDILELSNHEAKHNLSLLRESKRKNNNKKNSGSFAIHSKADRPKNKELDSETKEDQDS